eukprot:4228121-Prymnesium_polylepis.1
MPIRIRLLLLRDLLHNFDKHAGLGRHPHNSAQIRFSLLDAMCAPPACPTIGCDVRRPLSPPPPSRRS